MPKRKGVPAMSGAPAMGGVRIEEAELAFTAKAARSAEGAEPSGKRPVSRFQPLDPSSLGVMRIRQEDVQQALEFEPRHYEGLPRRC